MMAASENCFSIIKKIEGLRLVAYQDSKGVWTIGYGHTHGVHAGQNISQSDADQLLEDDAEEAQQSVNRLVKVALNQNQFDALVSFVFNIGAGQFSESTMLRFINEGKFIDASNEFSRYIYCNGKKLRGLVNRRKMEADLFREEM